MSEIGCNEEEDESFEETEGYCHFNNSGIENTFDINIFGYDLRFVQAPANRTIGHGAVVWDAAVILAKYMENDPKTFSRNNLHSKTVIELGSGCSLGGVAFMLKGAKVYMTDLEPVTETLTRRNAKKVYRQVRSMGAQASTMSEHAVMPLFYEPEVFPIDWTCVDPLCDRKRLADAFEGEDMLSTTQMMDRVTLDAGAVVEAAESEVHIEDIRNDRLKYQDALPGSFDYIVLTDCVFSVLLVEDLVRTIRHFCGPRSEVICCHEIRDEGASHAFVAELKKYFSVKRISMSKLHPDYRNELVEMLVAKPKRKKASTS
jgi:predicted nicotinamide N-methyase